MLDFWDRSSSISSAARLLGGASLRRSATWTPVAWAMAERRVRRGSRRPFSISESWLPAIPTRSPSWSRVRPAAVRKVANPLSEGLKVVHTFTIAKVWTFFLPFFVMNCRLNPPQWKHTTFLKAEGTPMSIAEMTRTYSPRPEGANAAVVQWVEDIAALDAAPRDRLVRRLEGGVGCTRSRNGRERDSHQTQCRAPPLQLPRRAATPSDVARVEGPHLHLLRGPRGCWPHQ